jgi:hypothetical protein
MDRLFLDIILLLIGGAFEELAPPPERSTSMLLGVAVSRRKTATRVEIWLGGTELPEPGWASAVEAVLARTFPGEKIFPFRPFKANSPKVR